MDSERMSPRPPDIGRPIAIAMGEEARTGSRDADRREASARKDGDERRGRKKRAD